MKPLSLHLSILHQPPSTMSLRSLYCNVSKPARAAKIYRAPGAPTFRSARSEPGCPRRQKCRRSFGSGFASLCSLVAKFRFASMGVHSWSLFVCFASFVVASSAATVTWAGVSGDGNTATNWNTGANRVTVQTTDEIPWPANLPSIPDRRSTTALPNAA